jgi:hypothetical protein
MTDKRNPTPTFDPNCEYLGPTEFAKEFGSATLKELHNCKNKRCPWTFCESAFKAKACPEQEVMP